MLLELIMLVAGCIFMYRCAVAEDMSGIVWIITTIAICFGVAFVISTWAYVRVLVGVVVAFCAMIGWNIYRDR